MVSSAPVEYEEFGPSDGSHSRAAGGKRTLSKKRFDSPGPWDRSVVPEIFREVGIGFTNIDFVILSAHPKELFVKSLIS